MKNNANQVNRNIAEPPSLPVHQGIIKQINETIISLKVHSLSTDGKSAEEKKALEEAKKTTPEPDMESIVELLGKCRNIISGISGLTKIKF